MRVLLVCVLRGRVLPLDAQRELLKVKHCDDVFKGQAHCGTEDRGTHRDDPYEIGCKALRGLRNDHDTG